MNDRDRLFLGHVLEAIAAIESFTAEGQAEFMPDLKTQSAVVRQSQIVIPGKIRRKFGFKQGTRVQVAIDEHAHRIILAPVTPDYIQHLRGKYKGSRLLTALAGEKKREKEL